VGRGGLQVVEQRGQVEDSRLQHPLETRIEGSKPYGAGSSGTIGKEAPKAVVVSRKTLLDNENPMIKRWLRGSKGDWKPKNRGGSYGVDGLEQPGGSWSGKNVKLMLRVSDQIPASGGNTPDELFPLASGGCGVWFAAKTVVSFRVRNSG